MVKFGDFEPLCKDTPSYPWCNLFYRQLQRGAPDVLRGLSIPSESAPVGVDPTCGIPRVGHDNSVGNVANIAACGLSIFFTAFLIFACNRRKAAVGRIELRTFLTLYLLTLPLQLITTGSFLEQGSTPLVALTAIHAGAVVALFWSLLANAIVATQVVEDGTLASLVPFYIFTAIALGVGIYISLDIALGVTNVIGGLSSPPSRLGSIALFVITSIWPAACAVLYLIIMSYIVLHVLNETRPMWYYILASCLFVLSQLAWFLLGRVICKGSNSKIDGSFVATILESAAVGVLYLAWKSITEESWDDEYYPSYPS
ncbi:Chitin synthase export chaperone [Psilocybe cubensis]|uniref:Chitin synthase export chaperone n=2 Tax=Psilocybe cubensis TaxID=181762 RepID=A0ACB8HDQ6_PSICU|nr:Chitin synthase export chaperone [Psilocybe cubensis]KAH9486153.1 Chitin synthase export chaperone [Psilocybe cubensis]